MKGGCRNRPLSFDNTGRQFVACFGFRMTIEIVERPAFHVAGMSILTKPMSPQIPALWPKFIARSPEIEGRSEPNVTYGVMRHEPPDSLFYMAGVAVPAAARAPAAMEIREIAAGSYARFQYPIARLGEGFGEIFGRLLPSSGRVQAPGYLLERYDESFDPQDVNSLVEILIPVLGSMTIVRRIKALPAVVFDLLIAPAGLKQWIGPDAGPVVIAESDARVGGSYRLRFRMLSGSEYESSGEYLEVDAPRRLVTTWTWADDAGKQASRVEIGLRQIEEGTELTFTHALLPDQSTADGHRKGWSKSLDKLTMAAER